MHLTKNQLWSLVIAFIMVTSTVGFLISANNTPATQTPVNPDPQNQQTTQVNYQASNIQAKVIQLFPTAVLVGTTDQNNVAIVKQELELIDGILSAENSQIVPVQAGRTENFRAELRLSSIDKIGEIISKLNTLENLSGAQMFVQALVSLPPNVTFTNPSLDLDQNYTFPNPQTQAYITTNSVIGDELIVSLSAVFQGQAIVEMIAFEESNLTNNPQFYFFDGAFTLSKLEEEFFVRSSLSITQSQKLDSAKTSLETQFSNSSLLVAPTSNDLRVNFTDSNSFFAQDLETFLNGFEGISSYNNQLSSGFTMITTDANVDYAEFKSSLETQLNSLDFKVSSIEDPMVSFQGTIIGNKTDFLNAINSIESANGITIEVLQKAVVETDSVFVSDQNLTFALPQGSFSAFVSIDRKAGDEVSLTSIMNASERSGVTDIQAQETQEELEISES